MFPSGQSQKQIRFPVNCSRCNQRVGSERWKVTTSKSYKSPGGPIQSFNEGSGRYETHNTTINTTVTQDVEVPICPTCLAEFTLFDQEASKTAKKSDKQIYIGMGVCFVIGAVFYLIFSAFDPMNNDSPSSTAMVSICVGGLCTIAAMIIMAILNSIRGGIQKKKDPREFVHFSSYGLGTLTFENRDYQREYNKLNHIPDYFTDLEK